MKGVPLIALPEPLAAVGVWIEAVLLVATVHVVAPALPSPAVVVALVTHGPDAALRLPGEVASVVLEVPHHGLPLCVIRADEVLRCSATRSPAAPE